MEFSSPLAAIRPQPCPPWGNRKDLPIPRALLHGAYATCGANSFDFKSMSMHYEPTRPITRDYFALKPPRHSSPTAILTADLDANFHIDQSPQAPTPRRSLFTADLFKPRQDVVCLQTPTEEPVALMTPPIVPSSPMHDLMDLSPLPHKAPFFVAQVTLPSPTPEQTPTFSQDPSPNLLSPLDADNQRACPVQLPTFVPMPEPRRPVSRPSLTRTKAYSSASISIPPRPNSAENELAPFRFGNPIPDSLTRGSTPHLLQSLVESPNGEMNSPLSSLVPLPAPRRLTLGSTNRAAVGSPCGKHVRKPSGGRPPFVRPQRKLIRRSLSMFQHPDDVMREERDSFEPQPSLATAMDVDQERALRLPHFIPDHEPDSLPRISQETMADVLDNKYSAEYDQVMIVDCRFEYEYNGGHVEGAVNFNDKQLLVNELFNNPSLTSSTLLILHCEYSVHRAPLTAKFLRSHDRNVNAANYPRLNYPELYILDGGYSKFFTCHRSKCYPQNYVEMNDQRHEQACERGMAKVKQRQKLFRNQTFAFGENHDSMDDSPTALGRSHSSRDSSMFAVGADVSEGIGSSFQRRMASY